MAKYLYLLIFPLIAYAATEPGSMETKGVYNQGPGIFPLAVYPVPSGGEVMMEPTYAMHNPPPGMVMLPVPAVGMVPHVYPEQKGRFAQVSPLQTAKEGTGSVVHTAVEHSITRNIGFCQHELNVCLAGCCGGPIAAVHCCAKTETCIGMVGAVIVCPYISCLGGCISQICCPIWLITGPCTKSRSRSDLQDAIFCRGSKLVHDVLCSCY